MAKPCDIAGDSRPIKAVYWGEVYGDGIWRLGDQFVKEGVITKIVTYEEDGQSGPVPWVAVYVGEKLVARSDCAGATIHYE